MELLVSVWMGCQFRLDLTVCISAAGLLQEALRNPGDMLSDLARKGLQEREPEKLHRNKFKAVCPFLSYPHRSLTECKAVEYRACTLHGCVEMLMAGTFREEHPSIRQPYKRCMEYYHR